MTGLEFNKYETILFPLTFSPLRIMLANGGEENKE